MWAKFSSFGVKLRTNNYINNYKNNNIVQLNKTFFKVSRQVRFSTKVTRTMGKEEGKLENNVLATEVGEIKKETNDENEWWFKAKETLLQVASKEQTPLYVYDKQTINNCVNDLKQLTAIDTLFYAIKANANPSILKFLEENHINFEVVSTGELDHILQLFPDIDRNRILFTPNFAPKVEYQYAFDKGVRVTVDSLYPLKNWPTIFEGREVMIRLDPGYGDGHHEYVVTGGVQSKFGVSLLDIDYLAHLVQSINTKVIGLHCHAGSGIRDPDIWVNVAKTLVDQQKHFPHLKFIDVGGGLAIVENKLTENQLIIEEVNQRLEAFKKNHPDIQLWMEPGRYYVAKSGVLLGSVTQIKSKGDHHFVGIDTGFNSLVRPILYGAYHQIVNLTKIDSNGPFFHADIVGPICETGDVFGKTRVLPANTEENDVILIATAGAYGRSMSSNYNLRDPAKEYFLE